MKAECPAGHKHDMALDASGFEIYQFVVGFTGPCKWNRFRLFKTREPANPTKSDGPLHGSPLSLGSPVSEANV